MWRFALVSILAAGLAHAGGAISKCDVAAVYNSLDTPLGTAALTELGDIQEVEVVFVPAKLEPGAYSISVTRKASNVYRVDGKDMYLKTRYCYEYAYSQHAVLNYEGNLGFDKGELVFAE